MKQSDIDFARQIFNKHIEGALEEIAESDSATEFGYWPDDCGAFTDVLIAVLLHQRRVNDYCEQELGSG